MSHFALNEISRVFSFHFTHWNFLSSFEKIIYTINNESRNKIANQVSMFDLMEESEEVLETQKYTFIEKEEMPEKELLILEKEMLGVYISGHPLDKIRDKIAKQANISTLDMIKMNEEIEEFGEPQNFKDGQTIKFVGVISKVNKKFTRKNTTMAFVNLEDFYGTAEVVIFDTVYSKTSHFIVDDNIVLVEGRLSIREDEPVKIVATNIKEFSEDDISSETEKRETKLNTIKTVNIDITNLEESKKERLRGAIKFFSGDRANVKLEVTDNRQIKPCGGIFLTDKVFEVFKEIVGETNIKILN